MELVLRPWTIDDAAALHTAVATSPDLLDQLGDADLHSDAACAAHLERGWASAADDRVDRAICVDGVAVGHIGLSHLEYRNDTAWVSYWVATGFRRRGLASAALTAMAAYGFDDLDLYRLELGHRVDNLGSCRVATNAGFAVEGIERSKLRYGDLRFDTETHARLASDPVPRRPSAAQPSQPV